MCIYVDIIYMFVAVLCAVLCAVQCAAQPTDASWDGLRTAILGKSRDQLKKMAARSNIEHEAGASKETLQKLVYEHAQRDAQQQQLGRQARRNGAPLPAKHWDGTPMELADAQEQRGGGIDGLFKSLDVDRDGKLSRSELQAFEAAHAAAQAAGEDVPPDFFAALDRNQDGSADREEVQGFLSAMAGGLKQEL